MKKILKPFSIAAAKAGAKVVTKSGLNVEILKYDFKGAHDFCIVAVVSYKSGYDEVNMYNKLGKFFRKSTDISPLDLKIEANVFEDGDIISCNRGINTWIIIFKKLDETRKLNRLHYYVMLNANGDIVSDFYSSEFGFVIATDEEKRKLFDALAEDGKRWNPERKAIVSLDKKE